MVSFNAGDTILKTEDITKKEAIMALQNAYIDFDDIPDWFKQTAGKAEGRIISVESAGANFICLESFKSDFSASDKEKVLLNRFL